MLRKLFTHYKKNKMELKLKVFTNQSTIQNKQERNPDNTIKTTSEKTSRIAAKDESGNVLQFVTDYETGKGFELDKELNVTIQ
jgi:hypothetical protein